MAAINPTVTEVIPSANATIRTGVCGATIVRGNTLYLDSATNTLKLADSDLSSAAATLVGIADGAGASGQTIRYVTEDPALVLGATLALAVGDIIMLSDTAGAMTKTRADLTTGDYVTVLGVCTSAAASTVNFKVVAAGAAIA